MGGIGVTVLVLSSTLIYHIYHLRNPGHLHLLDARVLDLDQENEHAPVETDCCRNYLRDIKFLGLILSVNAVSHS